MRMRSLHQFYQDMRIGGRGCMHIMLVVILLALSADAQEGVFDVLLLRPDDAPQRVSPGLAPGSHIKVFIPSLPYIYTSHAINAGFIRPARNERGWDLDLATSYRQIDERTYEFTLRQGVRFQDGSPFTADAVVMNMEYFKRQPVLYSKINTVFDRAVKIDDETVRFFLTEKYGSFMNDIMWMHFYTEPYLKKFGWNGKATTPNLAEAGPYGLGPYILKEGYIEGDRHTAKAVLEANPYYWDTRYPSVETVTIYTQLNTEDAKNMALYHEGQLDITFIPFEDKVETIVAPYSKLVISPSTDNIAIHLNLRNGHRKLLDKSVRRALNEALHQRNLLHFVFEGEGELSPTMASPYFPGVKDVVKTMKPYSDVQDPYSPAVRLRLKGILEGLNLKVLTQDRFLTLWRGIEYQLRQAGVTLDIIVTTSEKDIFGPLLKTNARQNTTPWDLLVWGDDDWFFNHPWSAFLVYRTHNVWSTIFPDSILDGYIEDLFRVAVEEPKFTEICRKIMQRVYDEAYMLFVPTPNKVFAVNKEVVFHPYKMASIPLWEIQVTDQHWSVRQTPYPDERKRPIAILRENVSVSPTSTHTEEKP